MIVIYDFDGTLTPYSLPQYEIIKKCGYNEEKLINRVAEELTNSKGLYEAYYKCYTEILLENNILLTKENVCLGADKVKSYITFNEENGIYKNIDKLVTDEKKVDAIKDIQLHNEGTNKIIYFGDGLTDELAFQYVHKIGGKNVFIASNKQSIENYNKLNINGIIDKCYEADFGKDTKLSEYIQKEIELEREC